LTVVLILLSATKSSAKDKIILYNGTSISGKIVSIDSIEIRLKFLPQDGVLCILREFEVKAVNKVSYNDYEYDLDKIKIEELIKIFNKKEKLKDSDPLIQNRDKNLSLFSNYCGNFVNTKLK
jgi:hypothetical protein